MNEITITIPERNITDWLSSYPDPDYAETEYLRALKREMQGYFPGISITIEADPDYPGPDYRLVVDGDWDDEQQVREVYEAVAARLSDLDWLPLNTAQAARQIGVSAAHLRRMIASGQVRARKLGHDWLIRPADLVGVKRKRKARGKSVPK